MDFETYNYKKAQIGLTAARGNHMDCTVESLVAIFDPEGLTIGTQMRDILIGHAREYAIQWYSKAITLTD